MMNILLWVLQILAAFMYGTSGVMKVFMFDKITQGVASFGALPKKVWIGLGVVELICVFGLIVPSVLSFLPMLTVVSAIVLALESSVFVWVHIKYREPSSVAMCTVLGLLMLFVAYGRMILAPIL